MPDNVQQAETLGITVATDDVSGVHYQRVKLVDGTADGTAGIPGDATFGLDVDVTRLPALPAGSNTIGTVTANQGTSAAGSGAWPITLTNTADTVVKPGDATNNAIRVNQVAGGSTVTDITATGSIAALNGTVQIALEGRKGVAVVLTGTWIATVIFEVSADGGSTWNSTYVYNHTLGSVIQTIVSTNGTFSFLLMGGMSHARVRASAYTSGTISISFRATDASSVTELNQIWEAGLSGEQRFSRAVAGWDVTSETFVALRTSTTTPASSQYGLITRNIPSGTQDVNLLPRNRSDTFTATGNGTTVNVATTPVKSFAIQVKGTGAAPTSWDVRLEGSLNNSQFSQILQHTTTDGDGAVVWSGSTTYPSLYFRSRVAGLVLGSATNIVVTILGVQ